jgi:DNA (cytosine-5)-methyltransferase 1
MPASEHSLAAKIAALLPTPAVNDMGEGKTLEWWDDWAPRQKAADGRPAPHGRSLAIEAQRLLPTPTTQHASGGYNPDWGHGMTLLDAAKEIVEWTGPTTRQPSHDGNASSDDTHPHQLSLDGQAIPA